MNGIDKIIARLQSDTQTEIDALNAETEARCAALRAEYAEKAQAVYDARIRTGTEECRVQGERLASAADMESRKGMLAVKQSLVAAAFLGAVKQLTELPRDEYVSFLAGLAAKAAADGTEELVFNAKDAAAVGADVAKEANALLGAKGRLTVSPQTRDIPGGVIVRQGDIETNCAVDVLVQMQRSALASQVAEVLFA
jgi:V/A-type H+-transporting ATPase subunit E